MRLKTFLMPRLSILKHHRIALAKFRCSVALILLETGRYEDLPLEESKCSASDSAETEHHVAYECPVYDDLHVVLQS